MSDNCYDKEEDRVGACLSSSCYPSVFETFLTIKIRNVDLHTGLSILESLSKDFSIKDIYITKRALMGGSGT